jgi:ABC-type phosphate transport system substrate-binding protein
MTMRTRWNGRVAHATGALAAAAVLAVSARSVAQTTPACSTLAPNNPVFISGSSASQPVLQALAKVLGTSVSIIYQNPDSCFGLNDAIVGQPSTEAGIKTQYLDPVNGATACTLDAAPTTQVVDIGVSDVFPATCQGNLGMGGTTAGAQMEVEGPIQAMTIAVPQMSTATSINAAAANIVFGNDAMSVPVGTWTVPLAIFTRPDTSGTLNMIGTAIGLLANRWVNATPGTTPVPTNQASSTGAMFSDLAGATNANATIGILSDEAVIQNNAKNLLDSGTGTTVKPLAFQGVTQTCAYLPDSKLGATDRINVREGRYDIWGPLHFVTNVSNGALTAPHAAAAAIVLNYFIATGPNGGTPIPTASDAGVDAGAGAVTSTAEQALIAAEANTTISGGGVVPWCAMEVVRTSEIGAEASYQPDIPCGCYFESIAAGATVSPYCQPCNVANGNADCNPEGGTSAYPVCRYGYCEVK